MRRAAAYLAILVALTAAPGAAAAERSVTATPLVAQIGTDPWQLTFVDSGGRTILSEALGRGLAYSNGAGQWFYATRVTNEQTTAAGAYEADVATTNPLTSIRVRIARDSSGVIALSATAPGASQVRISFESVGAERYLGFGERSNAVDQRGQTIENYVAEGPYQPAERPAIAGFVPAPGYHPRDDATYYPIPWLLSTRGYGVLVDNDERSEFHLASDDPSTWSATVDAGVLRLRVFAGPTPARALARFSARTGRQPAPAAPWFLGPWFQPSGQDATNIAALSKADAPASVMQTYTHYLPCGDQRGKQAAERGRTKAGHASGLAVTTYFNPMICTDYSPVYDEARAKGYLTKNALGQPYEYRYTGSSVFLVGQVDFSSPAARTFYGNLLAEAVGNGYDGWMEDFGEYTPTDAVSSDGTPGPAMHNRYPRLYHRAAREFTQRTRRPLARFNRSGWTGTARYSQIVWNGDPTTDWGFDGLTSALRNGLTMGLSGVSLWGSDIGGFFTLSAPQLTPELLMRWIELGAVSGVMRTQANGFTLGSRGRRPQITDPNVLPVWRRYAKLRTQLYPYVAAAARAYVRTGLPIMRHLALVFPSDPAAAASDGEFMFGPDLLAAPVTAPGARTKDVYLPSGRWVDLWRALRYTKRDGSFSLAKRVKLLGGGRTVKLAAPLEELPLLARAGTILPLLPPEVDTLTSYGRKRGLVHLRDRVRRMTLIAFPRGSTRAEIGPGEVVRSTQLRKRWHLVVSGKRTRRYSLQASLPFDACSVDRGKWSYSRKTRILRATFTARATSLTVRGC
jgi:alpha-glucosidase (family GH31 glycosyl hydrolase)